MPTLGQIIASITPPKRPVSKRLRWARRIGTLLIASSLPFLYRYWDRVHARGLLDGRIALIRSHSEPIFPSDFARAPVADDRNAARVLLHAADAVQTSKENWLRVEQIIADHGNDPSGDDLAFVADLVRTNQPALIDEFINAVSI